ncbi:MAG TPA: amidase [Gemmatimonadales bacterium]|nr:amidase [Gemmatimonadales bacterium]
MLRRDFLQAGTLAGLGLQQQFRHHPPAVEGPAPLAPALPQEEATIADLQSGMEAGRFSSRDLTKAYLDRIAKLDQAGPALNAVIERNPDAEKIAAALDEERKAHGARGPLHGIPVLVKDNCDSGDRMLTTAGSLALASTPAPRDSTVVARLRSAGAVLLGKTNLSEWANFRGNRSISGWSGRGGQTKNPYVLDRNPCGSSSGTGAAIAANLAVIGIGTETDGSITCPSSFCGLAGLKPTVGLVSRTGIIPISATQDTAGPMTRTMADLATMLSAIAGPDVKDAATGPAGKHALADYRSALNPDALKGARLGVVRTYFGFHPAVDALAEDVLKLLRERGAVLVDPVKPPADSTFGDAEYQVLLYEFKDGINKYLASRGPGFGMRKLEDLIAFNSANRDKELHWFGQETFEEAVKKGPLTSPKYLKAREHCRKLARVQGIDTLMTTHKLDALVSPTAQPAFTTDWLNGDHFGGSSTTLAAVAQCPHLTVPMGWIEGLPVGFSFYGRAWSEAKLIGYGYAFEQASRMRRPPTFLPSLETPR